MNRLPATEFDEVISLCLDQLLDGNWSVEECLRRYPEREEHLQPLLSLAVQLQQVRTVRPNRAFSENAVGRLQARLEPRQPVPKSRLQLIAEQVSDYLSNLLSGQRTTYHWARAGALFATLLLIASVALLAIASDSAVP